MPKGPALFGPRRSCKNAAIFLSAYVLYMATTMLSGQSYTLDHIAPTVTITSLAPNPPISGSISVTVTVSKPTTDLTAPEPVDVVWTSQNYHDYNDKFMGNPGPQSLARAVHRILADLNASGYLLRRRIGRRSHYSVSSDRPLRHPLTAHVEVERLLQVLDPTPRP